MQPQTPRVVLLGASNLALGLELAVDAARAHLGGPVEVLAALGRGRSFGARSRFLVRELPGIDACGLWRELELREAAPSWFVALDLGNDLAFGSSAAEVAAWVEVSIERLVARGARGTLSGLPLAKLEHISPRQFEVLKRVLFPFHAIERERLLQESRELEARTRELARRFGLAHVELEERWYGLDPIHFARAARHEVWRRFVAAWGEPRGIAVADATRSGRLWYESAKVLGLATGRPQPCARLTDGTTFSLY
ncbi:MAG: hypothetical protein FJ294_02785 [Planctomycetes bacterium]|nr:hypothetical protein [Planctomycetota bacterium]